VRENLEKTRFVVLNTFLLLALVGAPACGNKSSEPAKEVEGPDKTETAGRVAEGDQLYSQREDISKARQAVVALRQALTSDYSSYEASWKLARSCYYLGAHTNDGLERDAAFREGIQAGKTAVGLAPDKPEGHFWLGANYGGSAEHSTLAGLSSIEDIRREMETVLKIDEQFQGGSAYLALGQLYLEAPRILGGDYQKAIEYLEKGVKVGGNNALLRVELARAYLEADRPGDARKHIDVMLKITPNPDYMPEYKEAVDKANKLLERMRANRGG
jgi:tetratricopeptide (TPR) repeat protein